MAAAVPLPRVMAGIAMVKVPKMASALCGTKANRQAAVDKVATTNGLIVVVVYKKVKAIPAKLASLAPAPDAGVKKSANGIPFCATRLYTPLALARARFVA